MGQIGPSIMGQIGPSLRLMVSREGNPDFMERLGGVFGLGQKPQYISEASPP
jgi:hypothetical protein